MGSGGGSRFCDRRHTSAASDWHVLALSPVEFGKLIAEETEKWSKVIRAANIKPE